MADKTFSFRIPDDLRSELESLAEKDDRTLSNLIVKILRQYVLENKKQD